MDRNQLKIIREHIENREEKEKAIVEKLLPFLKCFRNIGSYQPIGSEISPKTGREDSQLYFPKSEKDGTMEFFRGTSFSKGLYGIQEPETKEEPTVPECLIVPLLGFSRTYRLGYGKGYYDRYLNEHPEIFSIGLAFDEQECEFIPKPWDVPLDVIITPTRILRRKKQL